MNRWEPLGARLLAGPPEPGTLIACRHNVYRTVRYDEVPACMWTESDYEAWETRRRCPYVLVAEHVPSGQQCEIRGRATPNIRTGALVPELYTYPNEHYPVCNSCHEPLPCREEVHRQHAERAVAALEKWQRPGVCPCCGEEVTTRQRHQTWPNIHVPGGPEVTFHIGRERCRESAATYDRKWAQEAGEAPKLQDKPDRTRWRGAPNASQRTILNMTANSELVATLCRVHDLSAPGAPSLGEVMRDPSGVAGEADSLPWSQWQWQPRISSRLSQWLGGLVEAGLIAEPQLPPDPERDRGPHPYQLTSTGREVLSGDPPLLSDASMRRGG